MIGRGTQKTVWTTRVVLALAFAAFPVTAFAQSTGMVRIGSVLVPTAYIFIGGIAIIGIFVAAIIALRQQPKRSKYRREWKFTCPRCNTSNSSEAAIQCRNCGNGVIMADYFSSPHDSITASFGCTECEQYWSVRPDAGKWRPAFELSRLKRACTLQIATGGRERATLPPHIGCVERFFGSNAKSRWIPLH